MTTTPGPSRLTKWLPVGQLLAATFAAPAHATDPAYHAFDNGLLRFGTGAEHSVDGFGNLRQPFYKSGSSYYKLTFSSYPLDIAIGAGTGAAHWTGSHVVINPSIIEQTIDTSGFVVTGDGANGGALGHGTLVSTATLPATLGSLTLRSTYTLGADSSFVRLETRLTNSTATHAPNVHLWVGTRDDYVGTDDRPTKTKGEIVDGAFQPIATTSSPSDALRITSGSEGVLFYSTTEGVNTVHAGCCNFNNVVSMNPTSSAITTQGDGSYAMYLPVGDLAPGESRSIVWFYAAGALADLDAVVEAVAAAAAPSAPDVSYGNGEATVQWEAPSSSEPITGYVVSISDDDGATWTDHVLDYVPEPLAYTFTGLVNGVDYVFRVAAITGTGDDQVVGSFSGSTEPVAPGVPEALDAPVIDGTVRVAQVLTALDPDAAWVNHGDEAMVASYQWQADGVDLLGATDPTYTITLDDIGAQIRVIARRTNEVGTTESVSAPTAAVPVNAPPVAVMEDLLDGVEGGTVGLDGSGSYGVDGVIVAWAWDCTDDGTFDVFGETAACDYPDDGAFTVRLRVTDDLGAIGTTTRGVAIANLPPEIDVFVVPADALEGTPVLLTADASDPGPADVLTYLWDFGDGETSDNPTVERAWAVDGTYTVTLTVRDGDGGEAVASTSVVVANVAPTLTAVTVPAPIDEGAPANLSADAFDPGADTLTFTWDLGDGTVRAGSAITHTWAAFGTYTVQVTVDDGRGGSDTHAQQVTIANVAPTLLGFTTPAAATRAARSA